jgi:hypothetical protein
MSKRSQVDLQDQERCRRRHHQVQSAPVAKGYVQQLGIDFDEVFAPVARLETMHMLLAYAVNEGWVIHHRDVKSAFLNGDLQEEVFMEQPPGFIINEVEHKVLHLNMALYGMR